MYVINYLAQLSISDETLSFLSLFGQVRDLEKLRVVYVACVVAMLRLWRRQKTVSCGLGGMAAMESWGG